MQNITERIAAIFAQQQEVPTSKAERASLKDNEDADDDDMENPTTTISISERITSIKNTVSEKIGITKTEEKKEEAPPKSWLEQQFSLIKQKVGLEEEPQRPKTWLETISSEVENFFALSAQQRLYGFGICFVLGAVMLLLSMAFLSSFLLRGFAVFYTFGNLCLLASTFFIVGPVQQLKWMMTRERLIPSVVYVISLMLTIAVIVSFANFFLILVLTIVQMAALVWYILTYIPFAQTILSSGIGTMITAMRATSV